MNRRRLLGLGVASLCGLGTRAWGEAGNESEGLIRLIVGRQAGGVTDVIARRFAERAGPRLGNMVVFNIGGAGGSIGTATAARAEPNGKTLLIGGTSDVVISPIIMDKVAESKSLQTIAILANTVSGIAVNPSLPVTSLADLVAYVKANPGRLSYASSGAGTVAHLGFELFKQLAGIPDIVHVPYKGAPPMLADLSAGHVSIAAVNLTDSTLTLHAAGKIHILVAASERRVSGLPDVPSSAEAGYPKLIAKLFLGLFAPHGTPTSLMQRFSEAVHEVMANNEFQKILTNQGFEPVLNSSSADDAQFVQDEFERWEPLVKTLGLKA